jgi:hypothetical protein
VDENIELYYQPGSIHILNEGLINFDPVLAKTIVHEEPIEKRGQFPPVEGGDPQPNELDRTALHPEGGTVARVRSIPEAVHTSWVVLNEQQHWQN